MEIFSFKKNKVLSTITNNYSGLIPTKPGETVKLYFQKATIPFETLYY